MSMAKDFVCIGIGVWGLGGGGVLLVQVRDVVQAVKGPRMVLEGYPRSIYEQFLILQ